MKIEDFSLFPRINQTASSCTAEIRHQAEDFQVDEVLPFEPDGSGGHIWLKIRKKGINTDWLANELAKFAGVPQVAVGYAGLKDRHAITSQWFSVNMEGHEHPVWSEFETDDIQIVEQNLIDLNPNATRVKTNSIILMDNPEILKGKKVLVVEDGPTLTHGGMSYGAGYVAATQNGAIIIDPKPYITGSLIKIYEEFPQISEIVPAMGYNDQQIKDMEETINKAECDLVIDGSPIDLGKLINCNKPIVRVNYDIEAAGKPTIEDILNEFEDKYLK